MATLFFFLHSRTKDASHWTVIGGDHDRILKEPTEQVEAMLSVFSPLLDGYICLLTLSAVILRNKMAKQVTFFIA